MRYPYIYTFQQMWAGTEIDKSVCALHGILALILDKAAQSSEPFE